MIAAHLRICTGCLAASTQSRCRRTPGRQSCQAPPAQQHIVPGQHGVPQSDKAGSAGVVCCWGCSSAFATKEQLLQRASSACPPALRRQLLYAVSRCLRACLLMCAGVEAAAAAAVLATHVAARVIHLEDEPLVLQIDSTASRQKGCHIQSQQSRTATHVRTMLFYHTCRSRRCQQHICQA
jgi:hypothetical protein